MIALALLAATVAVARIVSLAPALTEDLFAIGAGASVVGVDDDSDRPAAARRVTHVGSMRTLNSEVIAGLAPDLVVGIPYQAPNLRDLSRAGMHTRTLAVDTLGDDFAAIAELGRDTGHVVQAQRVLAAIRARLDRVRATTRGLREPRAFAVIGTGPVYTAARGSYLDDLFAIAHVRNAAAGVGGAFPALSAEALAALDPDVLVVSRKTTLPTQAPWSQLRAVRANRIVWLDEDDMMRPGPRVADVVETLAREIAPYR